MPELAEVEFFRRQWNPGLGDRVLAVRMHAAKRIFRGADTSALRKALVGQRLVASEARGKQLLFLFGEKNWIGIHLGMSGKLRCEPANFPPARHDHFVL